MATTAAPALERPLCVDLDGTLVKSDTLVDSLLLLVRSRPLDALKTPLWALRGKANLKREVTARVTLNVEHLPYNRPLLEYLMAQRGEGRKTLSRHWRGLRPGRSHRPPPEHLRGRALLGWNHESHGFQ